MRAKIPERVRLRGRSGVMFHIKPLVRGFGDPEVARAHAQRREQAAQARQLAIGVGETSRELRDLIRAQLARLVLERRGYLADATLEAPALGFERQGARVARGQRVLEPRERRGIGAVGGGGEEL